jgi:hypothetical protein
MVIVENGGSPVMTMTDSIYWLGTPEMLPVEMIRKEKTAGYFESPEYVNHFFVLKTGQYEYEKSGEWYFKMRGLNVDRDLITGKGSFFRRTIKQACSKIDPHTHPEDVIIRVNTRRLISIGAHDLPNLGAITEGITEIQPFVMSSKQVQPFIMRWRDTLDGAVWLETPRITESDTSANAYPLEWFRQLYEERIEASLELGRIRRAGYSRQTSNRLARLKRLYVWILMSRTEMMPPPGRVRDMTWNQLETWYGVPRTQVIGERK